MKTVITLIFIAFFAVSAQAAETIKPVPEAVRAEQQALAEKISARLKAGLEGQAYSLEQSCDEQNCTVTLSRTN
jgi:hypothetical protein